jgi:hypothetical protein
MALFLRWVARLILQKLRADARGAMKALATVVEKRSA